MIGRENDDVVKVEPDEHDEAGRFPVAKNVTKSGLNIELKEKDPFSTSNVAEQSAEDGAILDLSVPKLFLSRSNSIQQEDFPSPQRIDSIKSSSRHSSEVSSVSDPGLALAADALSLLKQSNSKSTDANWSAVPELTTNVQQSFVTQEPFLDASTWLVSYCITMWRRLFFPQRP